MTAPASTHANAGITDRVLAYFADNPGRGFRPAEVARALMPDEAKQVATLTVGTCMSKLARTGRLSKVAATVPTKVVGKTKTVTLYSLPS